MFLAFHFELSSLHGRCVRKPNIPVVFVSPTEHLSFIQAAVEKKKRDI